MSEIAVTSAETQEGERLVDCFETPEDREWSLDEEVLRAGNPEVTRNQLPYWVTTLSERECNRILGVTTGSDSNPRKIMEISRILVESAKLKVELPKNSETVLQIARNIVQEEGARASLRKWMARHTTDHAEEQRMFIRGPGIFRVREQVLLTKPTLKRIISGHFPNTFKNRSFTDIGTWDGEMSLSVQQHFSHVTAIEPNDERFEMLLRATASSEKIRAMQVDMNDIVAANTPMGSDAFLMSHIMYFFKFEKDLELLKWTLSNVNENGVGIIVLNDDVPEFGSREHLRRTFGNKSNDYDVRKYARFLDHQGVGYRITRPAMKITASTEDGLTAFKEVLKMQIAGDARTSNPEKFDRYVESLRAPNGRYEYTHRIAVLSYGPDFEPSNDLATLNGEYAHSMIGDTNRRVNRVVTPIAPKRIAKTAESDDNIWVPFPNGIQHETPKNVLAFFDRLDQATNSGMDDAELNRILIAVGIPRTLYLKLSRFRSEIECAQANNAENIADLCTKLSKADPRGGKTPRRAQVQPSKRIIPSYISHRAYSPNGNGHHAQNGHTPVALSRLKTIETPKEEAEAPRERESTVVEPEQKPSVTQVDNVVTPTRIETAIDPKLLESHAYMLKQLEVTRDQLKELLAQISTRTSS